MYSFSTVPSASEKVDRFLANVDVWQGIFEMLSVKHRIRLEMTNKRLGIMMLEYWKRETSFDTECITEMSKTRLAAFVAICVNRIGDALRSLKIREKLSIDCWTHNLPSIGKGCPNVETINFVFESRNLTLDVHFDFFSRLKTLTVSGAGNVFAYACASVFLSIPASIQVIRGLKGKWEGPFENGAQMEGFFADRPYLKEVYLGDLITLDNSKADIFRVIAERCPNLKSIKFSDCDICIDIRGVVALELMKELRIPHAVFDEMEIVTICKRSPLVEALEFDLRFSSNINLQSAALNALGSLTKLAHLCLSSDSAVVVAPSLATKFVRELAQNSSASLRHLHLPYIMPLPTAAIETLANGCGKLRCVGFGVRVDEVEPASIRFLIDCIVTDTSWIHETGEPTLVIKIYVKRDSGNEATAGLAAFRALADPAANLPVGVRLKTWEY